MFNCFIFMLKLKQIVVDKVTDQWQPRLKTCVRASGHHFEQLLKWNVALFLLTDLYFEVFIFRIIRSGLHSISYLIKHPWYFVAIYLKHELQVSQCSVATVFRPYCDKFIQLHCLYLIFSRIGRVFVRCAENIMAHFLAYTVLGFSQKRRSSLVSQGSVETLLSWGGRCLKCFTANLLRFRRTKFYHDRSVFISERELKFMFAICHRLSVCLSSVCRLSVVCL